MKAQKVQVFLLSDKEDAGCKNQRPAPLLFKEEFNPRKDEKYFFALSLYPNPQMAGLTVNFIILPFPKKEEPPNFEPEEYVQKVIGRKPHPLFLIAGGVLKIDGSVWRLVFFKLENKEEIEANPAKREEIEQVDFSQLANFFTCSLEREFE